ncbi:hypothetical protein OHD16_06230 [Sphingobacterium sp. ML3W]|uniref:hypothetical protein n=1 Tax=Sphingobacterium sp. ML3W TaxID=1538644 RepID=UPI00249A3B24|nr:hypothetical protein [Sphingobacterium sp. ML3W]WFA79565.1 hypothetical protein OGI71_26470 [Sphingobacterium sp. ML3W]
MELHTLYINIQIKKEKLNEFFIAKPMTSGIDDNWKQWWDSCEMYNRTGLKNIPTYTKENNRNVLDDLLSDSFFCSKEQYDDKRQYWGFTSLNFSENYYEILPMLAFLKQLGLYAESGYALIYDWMWGDETVMAFVEFREKQSWLAPVTTHAQIAPKILEEANNHLQEVSDSFYI